MYESYWSLHDKPFRNTPDPHYLFFARQHEEAMTRMLYAITEGQGGMMLTGDYGCGKTLLSRTLIDELDPSRYEVALVPYPNISAMELLHEVLSQFGYSTQGMCKVELLSLLADCLQQHNARGRSTIILIDEAQMILDQMTMEEIRLLLNFQQDRRFYLTMILFGQPELRQKIEELPQLSQRLGMRFHVGPFDNADASAYLRHRLAVAGSQGEIFTREAESLITSASGGIPRKINAIADLALLVGFGQKSPVIDEVIIRQVLADMTG